MGDYYDRYLKTGDILINRSVKINKIKVNKIH